MWRSVGLHVSPLNAFDTLPVGWTGVVCAIQASASSCAAPATLSAWALRADRFDLKEQRAIETEHIDV
jgi:hypothetical protein